MSKGFYGLGNERLENEQQLKPPTGDKITAAQNVCYDYLLNNHVTNKQRGSQTITTDGFAKQ